MGTSRSLEFNVCKLQVDVSLFLCSKCDVCLTFVPLGRTRFSVMYLVLTVVVDNKHF